MAALTRGYLIDKSALARMHLEPVRQKIQRILEADRAFTCAIVDSEILYSARNKVDYETTRSRRRLAYHDVPISAEVLARATEVQSLLAASGRHRVPIPDLIIAAAAELAEIAVLHYDHDYDAIAEVTGQSVEWVVERGSI